MFCDHQINIRNAINLKSSLQGEGVDIQYFWEEGDPYIGGTLHFIGVLDNHLETMLYQLTLISL